MHRDQIIEQSPVRVLDRGLHGGLGAGKLGVLMARAGAGKTAVLCHLGLDALLRHRPVLHVALGDGLLHVALWYAALFDDLAARAELEDHDAVRAQVGRDRVVKAFSRRDLGAAELDAALAVFERHMNFHPSLVLIDGFDWRGSHARASIAGFKAMAGRLGAQLWMTAETHMCSSGLAEPCEEHGALIDAAVRLEPRGADVQLELVQLGGKSQVVPLRLELETDTLRLRASANGQPGHAPRPVPLPASAYMLLSGGAAGAEAEFGACAEKYGVAEMTFTFPQRVSERHRGLIMLSDEELQQGAVSSTYLQQQMRRTYPDTPIFKKVVQSIWHQVNTAGEVFAVGAIQADQTVTGGTGWAVELARHWNKPAHVYDQDQDAWFVWRGGLWTPVGGPGPKITRTRFCGTGTRFLGETGKTAIAGLFARTFG